MGFCATLNACANFQLDRTKNVDCGKYQQEVHQLVGRQNGAPQEFNPKLSEATYSTVFRNSFRSEVAGDVISGANVGQVGTDAPVKCRDSSSNGSRDIQQ